MLLTISPGLVAVPLGMFSQVAITPTRLTGSFRLAAALNTPNTVAAPHMSYFISSMAAAGLIEIPPVSKVIPLPTSAMGADLVLPPLYSSTMSRGGCADPAVTDRNEPILSLRISV